MTTRQKLVQSKLTLLEPGEYFQNVSEACRTSGCSRQHFYDIKTAYESQNLDGLEGEGPSQTVCEEPGGS